MPNDLLISWTRRWQIDTGFNNNFNKSKAKRAN